MAIEDYIPKLIKQGEDARERYVVTHVRWNELWNLIIEQGDHTAEAVLEICSRILAHENNVSQHRNITVSTEEPSGGEDGDIWITY
jgi:hypothetical protein